MKEDPQRAQQLKTASIDGATFPELVRLLRKAWRGREAGTSTVCLKKNRVSFMSYFVGAGFLKEKVEKWWDAGVDSEGHKLTRCKNKRGEPCLKLWGDDAENEASVLRVGTEATLANKKVRGKEAFSIMADRSAGFGAVEGEASKDDDADESDSDEAEESEEEEGDPPEDSDDGEESEEEDGTPSEGGGSDEDQDDEDDAEEAEDDESDGEGGACSGQASDDDGGDRRSVGGKSLGRHSSSSKRTRKLAKTESPKPSPKGKGAIASAANAAGARKTRRHELKRLKSEISAGKAMYKKSAHVWQLTKQIKAYVRLLVDDETVGNTHIIAFLEKATADFGNDAKIQALELPEVTKSLKEAKSKIDTWVGKIDGWRYPVMFGEKRDELFAAASQWSECVSEARAHKTALVGQNVEAKQAKALKQDVWRKGRNKVKNDLVEWSVSSSIAHVMADLLYTIGHPAEESFIKLSYDQPQAPTDSDLTMEMLQAPFQIKAGPVRLRSAGWPRLSG